MFRGINLRVFIFLVQFSLFNHCDGFYTIYAPGTLKSNRKYTVCVAVHNVTEPATLNIGINHETSWSNFQQVELKAFETKMLDFYPPKLEPYGGYQLVATSIHGIQFDRSHYLNVEDDAGPIIYIETDKGKYLPGDLVLFRVVILDENAKPMKIIEPIKVQIFDNNSNRVKQFKDIPLNKGVYSGKFELTPETTVGPWHIKVFIAGKYNQEKKAFFNVEKYVLPKFETYIETDKDFVVADKFIKINVYGKYTYNKYVEGTAMLIIGGHSTYYNQTLDIEDSFAKFIIDYESLKGSDSYTWSDKLFVSATVEEKQTGIQRKEATSINIRTERYRITIPDDEIDFRNNVPYRIKAKVQHWNNSIVTDELDTVSMEYNGKVYKSNLDSNGLASFEYDYHKSAAYTFRYKDSMTNLPAFEHYAASGENNKKTECNLSLKTKRPKLNSIVEINVDFNEAVTYFIYTLTSHGNIIQNQMIKFDTKQNSSTFQVMAKNEMAPEAYVFVHYIISEQLKSCEMKITLPDELENKISISVPQIVKPGTNITMKINTQRDSHVCITAVDKSSKILSLGNEINRRTVLHNMRSDKSYSTDYPGKLSGIVTLYIEQFDWELLEPLRYKVKTYDVRTEYMVAKVYKSVQFITYENNDPAERRRIPDINYNKREDFPETWLFDEVDVEDDITTLTVTVPDTITTWIIKAFSVNENTGFGELESSVEVTVFQEFFISTSLPYSIKRSEIVAIPAVIFNYYPVDLLTEVVMENNFKEFRFIDSSCNKTLDTVLEKQQVTVPPNSGKEVMFHIQPLKAGFIKIQLTAENDFFTDGISQPLLVEMDGLGKYQNHDLYVSVNDNKDFSTHYQTNIPDNVVPDSEYLKLSISGNMLMPTMENLQDLVNKPKGCGEQNMINFAPNILVMEYLSATRQSKEYPDLVTKVKRYIEIGYQQQLKFWHSGGGYSVFGPSISSTPSNWLTAYVVRFFIKAQKYLAIDSNLIESSLNYLSDQQLSTGEFMKAGYLFHPAHQNRYGFTAFVLLSFQESKQYARKYKSLVEKGLSFLSANIDEIDDIYSLAIIANVFQTAKHEKASLVLDKIKPLAKTEKGLKWWSNNSGDRTSDIEITSYILMALLQTTQENLPIAKWLIEQRNSHGGFKSTQDTVVGLQALIKFARISAPQNDTLTKVQYKAYDAQNELVVDSHMGLEAYNFKDLQELELPRSTRSLDLQVTGIGNIFIQFSYQYHVDSEIVEPLFLKFSEQEVLKARALHKPKKSFAITTKVESQLDDLTMEMEVCIEYHPDDDVKNIKSNMIIVNIDLPSGYISNVENIAVLTTYDFVERLNADTPNKIILYFAYLEPNDQKCFTIEADKKDYVQNLQPSKITVYDYYHDDRRETVTYKL